MKIQIDTTSKTVKFEDKVKLTELLDVVKGLFPNNEWKEYSVEVTHITNWSSPIYIDNWRKTYPWIQPYYGTTTGDFTYATTPMKNGTDVEFKIDSTTTNTFSSGTYNIEINNN